MGYFETYDTVVLRSTLLMMMTLENNLGFVTSHAHYTNYFFQADLPESEKVYIELPKVYSDRDRVLKLTDYMYGI